ncbi:TIGR03668 family PPOX class F420-dependent oxidoreductase [Streptomyces sp. XM4011]|uniref:TIGR03668 family PPOX class F420-dependent oxidoreductase n=1 Tax=Streptomyces sp. XM4011 TaxID=2929780 RepID=UPI001FFC18E8|nr:TIGR03668 family PPOX class F420-dependent oxidoreductase [Streptomyces sp. XM4011]MCK1813285.1 TIGR03668 family PPOX class F420-dependent oxidoreductase [Streptomyces sp. XM4011]
MQLSVQQAQERFAEARVLRLATADAEGHPHLVAATFAVGGDTVVIAVDHKPKRSKNLKRLRNIRENPAVTLLVDHYEDQWDRLWWVRADGEATIEAAADCPELVQMLLYKYPQYAEVPPSGEVIKISVSRWSGWSAADS